MISHDSVSARFEQWLTALDERHLADLTPSEVARALRALSSCYVERRSKLSDGGALGSAGKRAAFALFYSPIHFLIARHIVRALALDRVPVTQLHDLGCGTGSAGAAWALETGGRVSGIDRHRWAVSEANWTYKTLSVHGRATQLDIARARVTTFNRTGILASYAINELPDATRAEVLRRFISASSAGAHVLVIEPIARRLTPWWSDWEKAFVDAGGQSGEWRFEEPLPKRQFELARAAGLNPRELTARSLWLKPRRPASST